MDGLVVPVARRPDQFAQLLRIRDVRAALWRMRVELPSSTHWPTAARSPAAMDCDRLASSSRARAAGSGRGGGSTGRLRPGRRSARRSQAGDFPKKREMSDIGVLTARFRRSYQVPSRPVAPSPQSPASGQSAHEPHAEREHHRRDESRRAPWRDRRMRPLPRFPGMRARCRCRAQPCRARSRARAWSVMRSASSTYFAPTAPMMPVQTTSTAVSDGRPPSRSTMPMAIGVVTDFGAIDSRVRSLAPSAHAMPTADTSAVTAPASSAPRSARARASACRAARTAARPAPPWPGRAGSARTARRRSRSRTASR